MGKNKKYAALFSCLVLVVALGAGIAGSRSAKKEADEQRKANEAAVSQAEDYSQMVTANRNAGSGNKIDEQNNTKSNTGTDIQEEMKGTGQISNDPAEPENDGSQNQKKQAAVRLKITTQYQMKRRSLTWKVRSLFLLTAPEPNQCLIGLLKAI